MTELEELKRRILLKLQLIEITQQDIRDLEQKIKEMEGKRVSS